MMGRAGFPACRFAGLSSPASLPRQLDAPHSRSHPSDPPTPNNQHPPPPALNSTPPRAEYTSARPDLPLGVSSVDFFQTAPRHPAAQKAAPSSPAATPAVAKQNASRGGPWPFAAAVGCPSPPAASLRCLPVRVEKDSFGPRSTSPPAGRESPRQSPPP